MRAPILSLTAPYFEYRNPEVSLKSWRSVGILASVAALVLLLAGCGQNEGGSTSPQVTITGGSGSICGTGLNGELKPSGIAKQEGGAKSLSGAGATFPAPVYSLWTGAYKQASGVEVAYQSIGSGGGVKQISEGTVDFGASDAPMKETELQAAKGGAILHIPTVFGAVVPTYRLPGVGEPLKFSGDVLGKIFSGQIKTWNDPAIEELNPGVKLPSSPIAVVHRSDGSGTTDIFTSYLAAASPAWVTALGGADKAKGKEVAWPVGIGGKGNEGVSAAVNQTEGSIGYVELTYALQQNLPAAWVKNRSGKFIQPCVETVTAAAEQMEIPQDLRFSLVDGAGANAYPISGATWLLVYRNQVDDAKGKALVNWLAWIMDEGEKTASTLNYAPLSTDVRDRAIAAIKTIQINGRAIG